MPISSQHLHNLSSHADFIQSCDIYDCFGGNTVEVEIMLEYVDTHKLTPRHIYRHVGTTCLFTTHLFTKFQIVQHVQQQPGGFQPLVDLDLFKEIHAVAPLAGDVILDSPRNKICRHCAAEILLWGLKDWWIRERRKGFLEEQVLNRPNCPEGSICPRQKDDHGKSLPP
jgi:E3 ubiquitin-protein ligase CHFR